MKPGLPKYLLSIFFVFLLFAKDVVVAFPSFIVSDSIVTSLRVDLIEEESERSRNNEEIRKGNVSEYLNEDDLQVPELPVCFLSDRLNTPSDMSFKQTFYRAVLTPPPNRG